MPAGHRLRQGVRRDGARHKVTYYVTTFIFNQTNVESPIYTYTAPLLLLILTTYYYYYLLTTYR